VLRRGVWQTLGSRKNFLETQVIRVISTVLLLAASGVAIASAPVSVTAADFAAQRAAIEADLADGKTYVEISAEDRAQVVKAMDRISGLLAGVDSSDSLEDAQKAALFNDQEQINTLLTSAAEDSRLICTRTVPTGSHRKVTVCQTVGERRRRREQDQDTMFDAQKVRLPNRE
jgi:hypothetical protein